MDQTLRGNKYLVEIGQDGTAMVRHRGNGAPVAELTTVSSIRISASVRELVDLMADVALRSPAPWSVAPGQRVKGSLPANVRKRVLGSLPGWSCRATAMVALDFLLMEMEPLGGADGLVPLTTLAEAVTTIRGTIDDPGPLEELFVRTEARCRAMGPQPTLGPGAEASIGIENRDMLGPGSGSDRRVNLFGRLLFLSIEPLWNTGMLGDDRRVVARLLDVFDVWMSPGASAAANADLQHLIAGHPGPVDHRMLLEHEEVRIILRVALTELSRSAAVRGDGERLWLTLATGEDGQRDILRSREDFRRFFEALMRPITAG